MIMKRNAAMLVLFCVTFALIGNVAFAETSNRDTENLRMLKEAFRYYAVRNGDYPKGANYQIVQQLADPRKGIGFVAGNRDQEGNLLDVSGRPYLFLFSSDGWVAIVALSKEGTEMERQVLLPPFSKSEAKR